MTIGELARLSGVTIRTLRYYDRIGLLPPAEITPAGYRLYNQASLERLHTILVFRELEVPLETIRRLLDAAGPDPARMLQTQRTLLLMQQEHINRLLRQLQDIEERGMTTMDFSAFDHRRNEDLTAQAEAAWGATEAWQDYARREAHRSPGENAANGEALMKMIGAFGKRRPATPADPEAQAFVAALQDFITRHFYHCTLPVLSGLADVYETPDFRANIDRAGGEGTAAFLAEAIRIHCGKQA